MPTSSHPKKLVEKFMDDYEWIHIALGLLGNFLFFAGSILFFYESLKTLGIWFFVGGSFFMLLGSIGSGLTKWIRHH